MFGNLEPGRSKLMVTSGLVIPHVTGQAMLSGVLCAQSTSLVVSIYDGQDTAGELVVDSVPLVAGVPLPVPRIMTKGLYIQFVNGTGSITVFYN